MAFRKVSVVQIREAPWRCLKGEGPPSHTRSAWAERPHGVTSPPTSRSGSTATVARVSSRTS
jgi:hypothetical protein